MFSHINQTLNINVLKVRDDTLRPFQWRYGGADGPQGHVGGDGPQLRWLTDEEMQTSALPTQMRKVHQTALGAVQGCGKIPKSSTKQAPRVAGNKRKPSMIPSEIDHVKQPKIASFFMKVETN